MNTNEVIANRALERMGYEKGEYAKISLEYACKHGSIDEWMRFQREFIRKPMMLEELLITMEELHAAFRAKAKEFDHVIKMGRTHLQDAVPIRPGQESEAYSRAFMRDKKN